MRRADQSKSGLSSAREIGSSFSYTWTAQRSSFRGNRSRRTRTISTIGGAVRQIETGGRAERVAPRWSDERDEQLTGGHGHRPEAGHVVSAQDLGGRSQSRETLP